MIDAQELMEQAAETAQHYLNSAVESIDKLFGDGHAQEHPELVSAFMQAAARDFHSTWTAQQLTEALEELRMDLADAIRDLRHQE